MVISAFSVFRLHFCKIVWQSFCELTKKPSCLITYLNPKGYVMSSDLCSMLIRYETAKFILSSKNSAMLCLQTNKSGQYARCLSSFFI